MTGRSTATACAMGVTLLGALALPGSADAFCGFYINGAGAKLYNSATIVVLMRDGTRTVLSMQNSYKGPPEDFAMVVPVPVVLKEENVKTLPAAVFDRIDSLAAPRLVEYWERDPCAPLMKYKGGGGGGKKKALAGASPKPPGPAPDLGVTIEAKFVVGEYDIVILSAKDATGLDTWLKREKYKIPDGAEPILRPYVASGTKFFVAKVDVKKVKFVDGRALLSPLRFHYDSPDFTLPIRLGLMNSSGVQDLLVHILGSTRYEAANYDNVTIPTNVDVADATRASFGSFYAALLDATLAKNPGAVVTEYAWDAAWCDPCPTPALNTSELGVLGVDALGAPASTELVGTGKPIVTGPAPVVSSPMRRWVLTRLHARYSKESLGEDLIFRAAPPIMGGREMRSSGALEKGATPGAVNTFQARYAIRHYWAGPIACDRPLRGVWGGPWPGVTAEYKTRPARDLAFVPRGAKLAAYVLEDVPELGVKPAKPGSGGTGGGTKPKRVEPARVEPARPAAAGPAAPPAVGAALVIGILGVAAGWTRRRSSPPNV